MKINTPNELPTEEITSDGLHKSGIESEINSDDEEFYNPFRPNDIAIVTKSRTIDSIIKRISYDEINLYPDFQRKGGIWKIKEKSRLIESLLLNIPLPVFYVAADKDDHWVVVDGLQRLTTLRDYIHEKDDKGFALKDLEFLSQFDGKRFLELPRNMQRRILETEPVFHIIQPSTSKTITRTIFKRINTKGMPLSPQEIRHALYQGQSTQFLKELSESAAFKQATCNGIHDDRMADRECVLRYLAFTYYSLDDYKTQDLDSFLSQTMEVFNKLDTQSLADYRQCFKQAMNNAYAVFGNTAFRRQKRGANGRFPINKALFETSAVGLGRCNEAEIIQLKNSYAEVQSLFVKLLSGHYLPESLQNNEKYKNSSFEKAIQRTADVKNVHFRFAAIQSLIDDVLQGKVDVN